MAILSDKWIREQAQTKGMIEPFVEAQRRDGCISYGLSSFGYDARVAPEFKIFTNVDSAVVDPKDFASNSFVDRETDVCVMQSALGLMQQGFRVVVLSDATGSPGESHQAGIERMRDAGAVISTVKGTFYEWVRTLHFADEHLDPKIWSGERPDGISL